MARPRIARVELVWDRIVERVVEHARRTAPGRAAIGPSRDWAGVRRRRVSRRVSSSSKPARTSVKADAAALRLSTEHDLLLTQRLVLQPELELERLRPGRSGALIGAGLSDLELGLRLRYEIAPRNRAVRRRELGGAFWRHRRSARARRARTPTILLWWPAFAPGSDPRLSENLTSPPRRMPRRLRAMKSQHRERILDDPSPERFPRDPADPAGPRAPK